MADIKGVRDKWRVRDELARWRRHTGRLEVLLRELEAQHPQREGMYDNDVATLVRFAWERARDEVTRLEKRDPHTVLP